MQDTETIGAIDRVLKRRIAILDGPGATLLQAGFSRPAPDLRATPVDSLNLIKPNIIKNLHRQYLAAGADILRTNTFNSSAISLAASGLQTKVRELNIAGARLAREAATEFFGPRPSRRAFIAGAVGPTSRTADSSQDTQRALFDAFHEQASGLYEGGVDMLWAETMHHPLNARVALEAFEKVFDEASSRIPVILSMVIADDTNLQALYELAAEFKPFAVGLNCMELTQIRRYIKNVAANVDAAVCCYPSAGLPDAEGRYSQGPEEIAAGLGEFAIQGTVNIVGGCCGTSPAHTEALARAVAGIPPRRRVPGHADLV